MSEYFNLFKFVGLVFYSSLTETIRKKEKKNYCG